MTRTRLYITSLAVALATAAALGQQREPHPRLFPPEQLGLLEGPDRDEWQQPERVMDHLGIFTGARVADVGAGGGWFTIRLAERVGQSGVVYAEDIQPQMIGLIARRVEQEGWKNVSTIIGSPTDPRLPKELNAVLMVDTYPQIREPVLLLKSIGASLALNGKLGIVDFRPDGSGGPGPDLSERISADVVRKQAAAAGLKLISEEQFLKYQYFLIFGR